MSESSERCPIAACDQPAKAVCIGCDRSVCVQHLTQKQYLEHLVGLGHGPIEEAVREGGLLCADCIEECGFREGGCPRGLFEHLCGFPNCGVDLTSITTRQKSCVHCGLWYCKGHTVELEKWNDAWRAEHVIFPLADAVCDRCMHETTAPVTNEFLVGRPHSRTSLLELLAGDESGKRAAILIHGILSNASSMRRLGEALVSRGVVDVAWGFASKAYWGDVTRALRMNADDIPLGLDLRALGKGFLKLTVGKAVQALKTEAHTVEGAAQDLEILVKTMFAEKVLLVGHSLGGIVANCAVGTFGLDEHVAGVITLGSPHWAWLKVHSPIAWDKAPSASIPYLLLLGESDWVTLHRGFGELSEADSERTNVTRILFAGLDHTTIHSKAAGSYAAEVIGAFSAGDFGSTNGRVFIRNDASGPLVRLAEVSGPAVETDVPVSDHRGWLRFRP